MNDFLDEMADEVARNISRSGRYSHGPGCGCSDCACGDAWDEIGRPGGRQTPPGAVGTQLPLWRGWTGPVTLQEIIAARKPGGVITPRLAPFFARGNQVYRISRAGIDRARALSIGSTKNYKSIAQRVIEHHSGKGGDPKVFAKIGGLKEHRVLVQAAILYRRDMHPRRTRLYEGWLQDRERPQLYQRNSTTFDEIARQALREEI